LKAAATTIRQQTDVAASSDVVVAVSFDRVRVRLEAEDRTSADDNEFRRPPMTLDVMFIFKARIGGFSIEF
jgi:hypothetical protein